VHGPLPPQRSTETDLVTSRTQEVWGRPVALPLSRSEGIRCRGWPPAGRGTARGSGDVRRRAAAGGRPQLQEQSRQLPQRRRSTDHRQADVQSPGLGPDRAGGLWCGSWWRSSPRLRCRGGIPSKFATPTAACVPATIRGQDRLASDDQPGDAGADGSEGRSSSRVRLRRRRGAGGGIDGNPGEPSSPPIRPKNRPRNRPKFL
jgi:hypothetical protein